MKNSILYPLGFFAPVAAILAAPQLEEVGLLGDNAGACEQPGGKVLRVEHVDTKQFMMGETDGVNSWETWHHRQAYTVVTLASPRSEGGNTLLNIYPDGYVTPGSIKPGDCYQIQQDDSLSAPPMSRTRF